MSNQPIHHMQHWPAYSLDMNIIETVWRWLLKTLSVDPPEKLEQLKQCAQQHWDEITPYTQRRLYHQMPQRIHLLHRMYDYSTKY